MSDNVSILRRIINGKHLFLTTRRLHLFLIITGALSCLQFIIAGLIGVIRGYSVQSSCPELIVWAWVICTLFMEGMGIKLRRHTVAAVMFVFILIPIMLVNGKHYYKGSEYYRQGKYDLAINEFREETEHWYRRLAYNMHEDSAMFDMAESYGQLGNFDKAREIFLLVQQRYPIFKDSAVRSINSIDSGLQKVKEYDALPAGKKADIYKLYSIALAYRYDLHCDAKALEIYTKIAAMPVDDRSKELAKKAIQELTAKENK